MGTRRTKSEGEPRYILDNAFRPDRESHIQPKHYSLGLREIVPLRHPRPWSAHGAPGRRFIDEPKSEVDKYVYMSKRRVTLYQPIAAKYSEPPLPAMSHSELIRMNSCPSEYDRSQILDRSSSRLYAGKYVKPKPYTFTTDGLKPDTRDLWLTRRIPEPTNINTAAAALSYSVFRPTTGRTRPQMGYHFTHRP